MNIGRMNDSSMFIDNSIDQSSEIDCLLCEKQVKLSNFPGIISKALTRKYCANLNQFFYTKDINKILNNSQCRAKIYLKEWLIYDFETEYCKRFYKVKEFPWKFKRVYKYYKKQVFPPKIYIREVMRPVRRFHYYQEKIKRMEGRGPIIEDEYESDSSSEQSNNSRDEKLGDLVLKDLKLNEISPKNEERGLKGFSFTKLGGIIKEINSACFSKKISINPSLDLYSKLSSFCKNTPTNSILDLNKALMRFDQKFLLQDKEKNGNNSKTLTKKVNQVKMKNHQSEITQPKVSTNKSSNTNCSGTTVDKFKKKKKKEILKGRVSEREEKKWKKKKNNSGSFTIGNNWRSEEDSVTMKRNHQQVSPKRKIKTKNCPPCNSTLKRSIVLTNDQFIRKDKKLEQKIRERVKRRRREDKKKSSLRASLHNNKNPTKSGKQEHKRAGSHVQTTLSFNQVHTKVKMVKSSTYRDLREWSPKRTSRNKEKYSKRLNTPFPHKSKLAQSRKKISSASKTNIIGTQFMSRSKKLFKKKIKKRRVKVKRAANGRMSSKPKRQKGKRGQLMSSRRIHSKKKDSSLHKQILVKLTKRRKERRSPIKKWNKFRDQKKLSHDNTKDKIKGIQLSLIKSNSKPDLHFQKFVHRRNPSTNNIKKSLDLDYKSRYISNRYHPRRSKLSSRDSILILSIMNGDIPSSTYTDRRKKQVKRIGMPLNFTNK